MLVRASGSCKRQTHPLVGEGAPHQQTQKSLTVTKIWFDPQVGLDIKREWATV
jgi:hypothetical protein